jgi:hypothetical protein
VARERPSASWSPVRSTATGSSAPLLMHPDDGRLIARLQTLTTELLADKRLGRWRTETVNELCRARLELEQRGLKNSPEYRDAMLRADQQAWRLVEWARLTAPNPPPPPDAPPRTPGSSP